jgi:hypothetical protein
MRGPVDYIIVGFEGSKFDGSILGALEDAIDKGIIKLMAICLISIDSGGKVSTFDLSNVDDEYVVSFSNKYKVSGDYISQEDIEEMAGLLEHDTTAGLLVIEHLWAIPLKKALIAAGGVLVADGRIHPDAAQELNEREKRGK